MSIQTSLNNMDTDFRQFYWLSDGMRAKPMRVSLEIDQSSQQKAIALSRGEITPREPVPVKVAMGHEGASFLWSTLPPLLLISDAVAHTLLDHGITGWRTYPVSLASRDGTQIGGYHGFAVTGRLGKMLPIHERPVLMPPRVEGGKAYLAHKGLCFDPSMWDHSDIALFSGVSFVVIRRNVVDLLKNTGTTNVRYQPISDIVTDAFV